jgi:hypothetical protein
VGRILFAVGSESERRRRLVPDFPALNIVTMTRPIGHAAMVLLAPGVGGFRRHSSRHSSQEIRERPQGGDAM